MNSPYATVILPTLNRHTTLPYAIASVLGQSQASLELLIVLDGATRACRLEAYRAASKDCRVRVLDLSKAPMSGERNTDLAVKQAASNRIFYVDDDDLLLPDHVAVLGAVLDNADVVDSRLCSADRHGRLHLGVARGGSVLIRQMLSEHRLKMLYDTHFAHRKDAYGKFSEWVPPQGESGKPVWEFFRGFANDTSCKWVSIDNITAINLHGAARRDMPLESRAREIKRWYKLVKKKRALSSAFERAGVHFNLVRLLTAFPPERMTLSEYLDKLGCYDCSDDTLVESIFDLFCERIIADESAITIASLSSDIVESGYWSAMVADQFCTVFGVDKAGELFAEAEVVSANKAGNLFARSFIELKRNPEMALRLARRSCELGPDPISMLNDWRASLERFSQVSAK